MLKRNNLTAKIVDNIDFDKDIKYEIQVRLHDAFAVVNIIYPVAVYFATLKKYAKD